MSDTYLDPTTSALQLLQRSIDQTLRSVREAWDNAPSGSDREALLAEVEAFLTRTDDDLGDLLTTLEED
jgi:hypothetical protein